MNYHLLIKHCLESILVTVAEGTEFMTHQEALTFIAKQATEALKLMDHVSNNAKN